MEYNMINFYFCSIATIGDSLLVIDRLVFKEKRFTLKDFTAILKNNFAGYEDLRREILSFEKYGNDSAADDYVVFAANALLDASDKVRLGEGFCAVAGFYTLEWDHGFGLNTPATPDGRLAGTPTSENQSPVYGADRKGLTALLKSAAKLPFERTANGGLNLLFSGSGLTADHLESLIRSYFQMGGIHAGVSIVDKKTLQNAMVNPEGYKSLTVRLYGFSEYFVSLPDWQKKAVLERTSY